jgi:preprotein translocase subunit Sec63
MAPAPITDDYYMILEVAQTASSEAITKSYKRLALLRHPDRNTRSNATETFQLVRDMHFPRMFASFKMQSHKTLRLLTSLHR